MNSNLAVIEDVTPMNLLVRIGEVEFLALTIFFRRWFINFRYASIFLNTENIS